METKKLGKTEVNIPVVGMGTWTLGGLRTPDYSHDEEEIRVLQAGIKFGLTLIDTAEMYAAGHAEELVGKAIKGLREKIFIVTKVLREHLAYEEVLQAAERSLKYLGTDYIDLYLIHSPNPNIPLAETMRAMEELADAGKIRFIGVSNFSVELLRQAQACLSKYPIVANQVEYNLLQRSIENELLPFAEREDITIMAHRPLAVGDLPRYSGEGRETLEYLSAKYHKTIAQVCLNWLIAKKPVIVIPKTGNVAHLKENVGAAGWRMAAEDYETINQVFPH